MLRRMPVDICSPPARRRAGVLATLALSVGAAGMAPAGASAQGVFSCRASAGRSTPGSPAAGSSSEPTVANSVSGLSHALPVSAG